MPLTLPKAGSWVPSPLLNPQGEHAIWASYWKSIKRTENWQIINGTVTKLWHGRTAFFCIMTAFAKAIKNVEVHLQCRKSHPRGQYYVPKRSASHEAFGFIFNPFNNLQRKTINEDLIRIVPPWVTKTSKSVIANHLLDTAGNSSAYKSDAAFYEPLLKSWWWGCYFITE